MAKGQEAKDRVVQKIKEIFGADFIGEVDKKIYVYSQEKGERVQVALSLTCPKTPVDISGTPIPNFSGGMDFENMDAAIAASKSYGASNNKHLLLRFAKRISPVFFNSIALNLLISFTILCEYRKLFLSKIFSTPISF